MLGFFYEQADGLPSRKFIKLHKPCQPTISGHMSSLIACDQKVRAASFGYTTVSFLILGVLAHGSGQ